MSATRFTDDHITCPFGVEATLVAAFDSISLSLTAVRDVLDILHEDQVARGDDLCPHLPRFLHDCDKCVFLGRYEEYDLYFCGERRPAVIARYGSSPEENSSWGMGPVSLPNLKEAQRRAIALCLASPTDEVT